MLDLLEDDDDVQEVYHNAEFPEGWEEYEIIKSPEITKFRWEFLLLLKQNMLKIYNSLTLKQINFLNACSSSLTMKF